MTTILLSFALFGLAVLAMALGTILSGRRIEGSCGGLNRIPGVATDCGGTCRRPCSTRQRLAAECAVRRARQGH